MPLKWRKQWIAGETFESAGVFDVDGDGVPDIVSGAFWYRGPRQRRSLCVLQRRGLTVVRQNPGHHERHEKHEKEGMRGAGRPTLWHAEG